MNIKEKLFFSPLAFPISPSGCANFCIALGATPNGIFALWPKTSVLISIFVASISTRGLILNLAKNDYRVNYNRRITTCEFLARKVQWCR